MNMPAWNVIDLFALGTILLSTLIGYRRRLSGEIANLLSLAAVFFVGFIAYRPVGNWLLTYSRLDGRTADVVAYVLTTIVAIIIMVIIRLVLGSIMRIVIEEEVDKIGGVIAGMVRSFFLITIVFLVMNLVPHEYLNKKFGEESVIGRLVIKCMPSLNRAVERLKEEVKS